MKIIISFSFGIVRGEEFAFLMVLHQGQFLVKFGSFVEGLNIIPIVRLRRNKFIGDTPNIAFWKKITDL